MKVTLHIVSGARAGHTQLLQSSTTRVGRSADAGLRFDAHQDLAVSADHAVISRTWRRCTITDVNSRNGLFVNGVRISIRVRLSDGDRVTFGAGGPEVDVRITRAYATAASALLMLACAATMALAVASRPGARLDDTGSSSGTASAVDSAVAEGDRTIDALRGELGELSAALRRSQHAALSAVAELERARRDRDSDRTLELEGALDATLAELARQQAAATGGHGAISERNARAVGRIFVEAPDGTVTSGTAFAVWPDATMLASRHVVMPGGSPALRLAVQFSYSDQVWPARVVVVAEEVDLAVLRVDGILGSVPVVEAFNNRSDTIGPGVPTVLIGYPRGGESLASDRPGRTIIRPATGVGVVTARSTSTLEVKGYGATGSSGSPVFDPNGEVIGVVFGGRSGAGIDYVVAVSAAAALRVLARVSPR
jgi:S1-C subfamily serine protease